MIFFEPVNLKQWNMFEAVKAPGHVENFYGVKDMTVGDIVLLHVGSQDKKYESGIYAYGKVVNGPYYETDTGDERFGKLRVDVEFIKIVRGSPLLSHNLCRKFIHQFRTVHKIDEVWYHEIRETLLK